MKRIFFILIILVVLIIGLATLISVNLDKIIIKQLARSTGSDVDIDSFNFNLFSGFHLKNLTLTFPQDTVSQIINEIVLRYSLTSLIKKQFSISEIIVNSPKFHLWQNESGRWNIPEKLLQPKDRIEVQLDSTLQIFKLPVRLMIKNMEINDAELKINIPSTKLDIIVNKGVIDDISFKSLEDFSGNLLISGAGLDFKQENLPLLGKIDWDLKSQISDSISTIRIEGNISEKNDIYKVIPKVFLTSDINVDFLNKVLNIKNFQLATGVSEKLAVSGSAKASFAGIDSAKFEALISLDTCDINGTGFISDFIRRFNSDLETIKFNLIEPSTLKVAGQINTENNAKEVHLSVSHWSRLRNFNLKNNPAMIDDVDIGMEISMLVKDTTLVMENFGIELGNLYSQSMKFSADNVNIQAEGKFGLDQKDLLIDELSGKIGLISPRMSAENPFNIQIDSINTSFKYVDDKMLVNSELISDDALEMKQDIVFNLNRRVLQNEPSLYIFDKMKTRLIINLDKIELVKSLKGQLEADIAAQRRDAGVEIMVSIVPVTILEYEYADSTIPLPFEYLKTAGEVLFNEKLDSIAIKDLTLDISDWLSNKFEIQVLNQKNMSLTIQDGRLDLKRLLNYPQFRHIIPVNIESVLEYSGNVSLNDLNDNRIEGGIKFSLPTFDMKYNEINLFRITSEFDFAFNGLIIDIEGNSHIEEISSFNIRPWPLKSLNGGFAARLNLNQKKFHFKFTENIKSESIDVEVIGETDFSQSEPVTVFESDFKFEKSKKYEVYPDFFIQGTIQSSFNGKITDNLHSSGVVNFNEFCIYSPFAEIYGVGGGVPFSQRVEFEPFIILKDSTGSNSFYPDLRLYEDLNKQKIKNIQVNSIKVSGREITDISGDVYWVDGYLKLPHYQLSLFDGNLTGSAWMRVNSLAAGDISYNLIAQGAEINSDKFTELKSSGGKASKIAFTFNFLGKGFVPSDPNFDVSGEMHITKISPKVAENMLLTLDPQQQDKGIQSTLYFLKKGWGVRSISFEVAHGFVYSSIITQQPPLKKPIPFMISKLLPLEKEIRLSRLPLKFFLK